ncbi:aldo/keto reductase [Candidatus Kaiserbacteria bacterium CG10_big_fil_rev_8_21_14_0_10_56_12]|uniref:Aldo/keto reductase n=1 Tax=Candidatus Kaiserbacteria bacterium CG10_big_fil_rev_8_21_14_0_10_56_12 TaxID=1974611 RepID=A0A2H0UAG9_9BACT|nr:MAG: aldo/keto reductase [Candidatus Kaiserbacteria bacterium CG10_big_fil_rev_8_21_14_0_10_56_12]
MNHSTNRLVLGTVQLGMAYGLSNKRGQPTQEEAFSLLDDARAAGIDTFDTAWAYGTAEDVLGAWIKERSLEKKVRLISKMRPHALNDYPDGTQAAEVVHAELEKSLQRLGVDSLEGYLFHSPHYIYLSHMIESLRDAKKEGLIQHIGVSIYDEPEALQAAELGVDYVQVPYNVFDQRLDKTDFFDLAKANGVTVFARSPFLQGLLLMQPNELPDHLSILKPELTQFIDICHRHELTQAAAALCFSGAACRADHIVFGVDTREQLEENVRNIAIDAAPKEAWVTEMKEAFGNLNRGAINPSLWSKIRH